MSRPQLAVVPALADGAGPASLDEILTYWRHFMTVEGNTDKTITGRLQFVRQLQRECGTVLTITRRDLILWMSGKAWTNKTRQTYRALLNTFFDWLQQEEFRSDNPAARLPKVKVQRTQPNPFELDEIETLLNSGIYRKTRAMVALHYYLGLRVSEIAKVHGQEINRARRTLTTLGKGQKLVTLPIPAALWPLVEQMPTDGYWFPNRAANAKYAAGEGHILGNSVSALLGNAIKRAGLSHRAHDLRAATATQMHRAGVSSFTIQQGMRHEMANTTNHYLKVDDEQVRGGFDALPEVAIPAKSSRRSSRWG
ncbi:tyrosine-type recombinase/integrase [uncultured Arthrobacter sp.]|uniref:tyrosine-type recombinase/integrase n=1 Tax=uncultured Arthrobacter sp. TaxID=114050 RepID=UPI002631B8CD|nr:tyrosine-type recombinase/integrase [uncultured Arthrobacter sp.]